MEGAGIFSLAGAGGDNSLRTAVHTRRIVDPSFGAKLTGSVGQLSFGAPSALDDFGERDRFFNIEPTPGTVVYVGYGSLIERRGFVDGQWVPLTGAYLTTERGVFLKASYLHRF